MADNQRGSWEGVVLVPAGLHDEARGGVTRPLVIGGEARRAVAAADAQRLGALVAERVSHRDRRRGELGAEIARLERAVHECEDLVRAARTARTAADARVEALTGALAALQAAVAAAVEAEGALHDAQASAEACDARLQSAAEHRTTLDRVVYDAEERLRARLAGSSDREWLPGGDADLHERSTQLAEDAERTRARAGRALAAREEAERAAAEAAGAHRKVSEAAAACRGRLAAAPVPDDARVRAALLGYASAATAQGLDPAARLVADELAALARRTAEVAALRLPPPPPEVLDAARQRARDAGIRVQEAERAARDRGITEAQWAELDEAYRAAEATEGRLRPHLPGRVSRRASDAQLRFDALLSARGFADALDYRLRFGERDRDLTLALDDARRLAEVAYAQLSALEEAAVPSEEEAELAHALSEAHRQGVVLLGFDPGERLEQFLRSKPDVPAALTGELVDALTAAGAAPADVPLETTARAWLARCDAQRHARSAIEAELALLDAQLEGLEALGPAARGTQLLVDAAQSVAASAGQRAHHAAGLADLIAEELDASRTAAAQEEADGRHAAGAGAALAALRSLAEDSERHQRVARDDARQAEARAQAAHGSAQAALAEAKARLAPLPGAPGGQRTPMEAALAELDCALKDAGAAHDFLASASAQREDAVARLAAERNDLARLDAAPPPPMGDRLSPFEIVEALRWLGGRRSDDAPVAVLMAGPDRGSAEGAIQLPRDRWVIVPSTLVPLLRAHDDQPANEGVARDLAENPVQAVKRWRRPIRRA